MNEIFLSPFGRPGAQAAEGLPRWRWTVEEIERIAAAGIFNEQDRFELIGGEIVPMSPKGVRHERLRNMLTYRWTKLAPDNVMIAGASQFNLDVDTFVNPDVLAHAMAIHTDNLRGPEALLVVEVAESSLIYDTKIKLPMHLQPLGQTYAIATEFSADDRLVPSLVPELAITLKTFRLD